MGICGSKGGGEYTENDAAGDAASKALEEALEKENKEENKIIKLLVLGTGESGKSTVFKQMKILYSIPDPPEKFIPICRANLFGNVHAVVGGMDKLGIEFGSPEGKKICDKLMGLQVDGSESDEALAPDFEALWADKGIQEAVERAAEYQLNDSTKYFWERAADVLKANYVPTEQDVLRSRVRTTGIVQQDFLINKDKYTMFDVGGQRNERRKWIHCFDNVTAVIFVTAISEYDQVLFEDENTNRMDEALQLFDQICNHPTFKETSMILFLNKRDLFADKIQKVDLNVWAKEYTGGKDYDNAMDYIKQRFTDQNKDKQNRQVYIHATCATDTSNVSFVMESVVDIILKENLRKMGKADMSKMMEGGQGSGVSGVKVPATWAKDTLMVCACFFTDTLKEHNVLVESDIAKLPAVEVQTGKIKQDSPEFTWLMQLGKEVPKFNAPVKSEIGSFQGNFKEACTALRNMLGVEELGFIYDEPVMMSNGPCAIVCVIKMPSSKPMTPKGITVQWKVHEDFENASYKKFCGVDTDSNPCKPPPKGEEFNPFAPDPVGHRWLKGITKYAGQVTKEIPKGVYLGIFKALSSSDGFKVMVNEHNRIMIPMVFLTENQLTPQEIKWMSGVRIRWSRDIKLLEGKNPNRGWLGPEMSGEEGATFPEKLWWGIDEMKARLDADKMGEFYDYEILDVDEQNNIQLILFAALAKDESDCLPGHIWVDRQFLETQNMKYMCEKTLAKLLAEQRILMDRYQAIDTNDAGDMAETQKKRAEKDALKLKIEEQLQLQTPLKWVNRVIMWCADKMPSMASKVPSADNMEVDALVDAALAATKTDVKERRQALISK